MRKKLLFLMCAQLLGAGIPLPAGAAVAEYDQAAALASARADVANWQSYLPDDVFVAHVSLPGTHDTATGHGWTTKSAFTGPSKSTTQAVTIDDQLANGVRAFDFRPGTRSGRLNCNHGMDQVNLYLDAAFDKLTAYLDAHPKEFFVIHLFRGNVYRTGELPTGGGILGGTEKAADQKEYNNLFNEFFNKGKYADYIVDYSPYLKVKDIRGKMVIFRRDRIDFAHVAKGGNLGGWPGSEENWTEESLTSVTHDTDPSISGFVRATDVSSPDNDAELQVELGSMTNLFNYNVTRPLPNDAKRADVGYKPYWTMIFTSGAYDGEETAGYLRNAEYTNPHFTGLLRDAQAAGKTGPAGTVFSDWVLVDTHKYSSKTYNTKGVELVPAIYENNFYYIKDYILDDEVFSTSAAEKIWDEDREYYMRNVETGMLLSGGQWYGTHATADRYGIRVTPHFDANTGLYTISTNITQSAGGQGWYGSNDYIDNPNPQTFKAERVHPGQYSFVTTDGKAIVAEPVSGWLDGTPCTVYMSDDAEGKAHLWELIPCDTYLNDLTAYASLSNPVDISFIGNRYEPNNHAANATWSFSPSKSASAGFVRAGDSDTKMLIQCSNAKKGTWAVGWDASWSFSKEFTDLPNGVYDFGFDYFADNISNVTATIGGEAVTLVNHVSNGGATSAQTAAENMLTGNYRFTRRVTVTDNKISVKFSTPTHSSATAIFFDNFTLTYYGPDPEVSCQWLQRVIDDASAKAVKYSGADSWNGFIAPYQAMVDGKTLVGDGHREADAIYSRLRALMYEDATEGADFTDAIIDNSFELGLDYGWNYTSRNDTGIKENSNSTYQAAGCDGAMMFNTWDGDNWGSAVMQTINDLPAGGYRLDALVTSFKDARLWLFAGDEETCLVNPNEKTVFNGMSLEFVMPEEGSLTFGAIAGTTDDFSAAGDRWYKADNFRLTYLGPVTSIEWTMETPTHGTLFLPFAHAVPEGLEAFTVDHVESVVTGVNNEKRYQHFSLVKADRIEAHVPYVMALASEPAETPSLRTFGRAVGATYLFTGMPVEATASDSPMTGTHEGQEISGGDYSLRESRSVAYFNRLGDNDVAYIEPAHAYIAAGTDGVTHTAVYVDRPTEVDITTGVENVSADLTGGSVSVYSVTGLVIRQDVAPGEALKGLAPGVYIVTDGFRSWKATAQ